MNRISSWVNMQDVFAANKGQGERMNEDVFGSLEAQGAQAQDRLKKTSAGFTQAATRDKNDAFKTFAGAQTADQAEAAARRGYSGPRTLKEFDPGVSQAIGDAAARINASPQAQFQQQYKGPMSAGGSQLDMALMNGAGGGQRADALRGKYGNLLDQFNATASNAASTAQAYERDITGRAQALAGKVPELRRREALIKRQKEDAALAARNDAARAAFDAEWERRTNKFKRTRGNQLQAAYDPPVSEELPFYPVS